MALAGSRLAIAWDSLAAALESIEVIRDPAQITKLSQDYYTFSPILTPQLSGKVSDIVVRPANEAEVLKVAEVCVKFKAPLTVRGAGTGNYGQCVPLQGGQTCGTG
jgi:FAD/FMN-containing dehydrogenase